MRKERLGTVIGGDAGGHDKTGTASAGREPTDGLGKQRISVHVADAGERVAAAILAIYMRKHTGGFGFSSRRDELGVEALLGQRLYSAVTGLGSKVCGEHAFGEPVDALTAFGLVPCLRHI